MLPTLPPRHVTLVLCDRDGAVLGSLPPFDVAVPWWQEVSDGREHRCASLHGLDVTVLRLLSTNTPASSGGDVTYLAEVARPAGRCAAVPWTDLTTAARPPAAAVVGPTRRSGRRPRVGRRGARRRRGRRAPARPSRCVRGTCRASGGCRRRRAGPGSRWCRRSSPTRARCWPTLDPTVLPPLIAARRPAGAARRGAAARTSTAPPLPLLVRMVDLLVGLQREWVGRTDELLALGRRLTGELRAARADLVARTVERCRADLDGGGRRQLESLVAALPQRFADIASCGVPDTLVHGDFHPGNMIAATSDAAGAARLGRQRRRPPVARPGRVRRAARRRRPRERSSTTGRRCGGHAVPGCDPDRAAALLGAGRARCSRRAIYRMFLDNIEPSERVYHAADPAEWLRPRGHHRARPKSAQTPGLSTSQVDHVAGDAVRRPP